MLLFKYARYDTVLERVQLHLVNAFYEIQLNILLVMKPFSFSGLTDTDF